MKHSKMHWLAALVLAMLMIFSSTTALADTLRYGDKGTEVKELQTRLKELGYYTRTIDGVYGSGTYKAIKAFQERNGLTVDGVTGTATLKLLNSSSARGATDENVDTTEDGTLRVGSKGEAVKAVQRRLKELGYYKNSIDGSYGNVTAAAVKAFQTKNGLTADGVCGPDTLEKLNSSSAKDVNGKTHDASEVTLVTERLDWFKDGVDTFPRKAIIQIKDCQTGLIFNAQVLYGSNHLDVEPLTAADTQILLEINGGVDFSYRRRPMLVKYDGHVYAASIYSEPHGDETITDNNFDGQFCLHFYGSKTHGTDRVDEDHKECEERALKYTW